MVLLKGIQMEVTGTELSTTAIGLKSKIFEMFSMVPIIGWLFGALIAVVLEQRIGTPLAWAFLFAKNPGAFWLFNHA